MTVEKFDSYESLPGEFEFSLVFGALKAKFARAKEEQERMEPYRMFTLDKVDDAKDVLARFRLVAPELVDDLQAAARTPGAVIDVGLPVAVPDTSDPVLLESSPFAAEQSDYFVLYRSTGAVKVDAQHMQSTILDVEPDFVARALDAEVVPMSKPKESEV